MELMGKRVLIFGGAGLVGQAICKQLLNEDIKSLVVCSLFENEAKDFVAELKKDHPKIEYFAEWGDIFLRHSMKDIPRGEVLNNPDHRKVLLNDVLSPLNREILTSSSIHYLLTKYRPDVVIDSINTASIIAYQNIFGLSKETVSVMGNGDPRSNELVEKLVCTQYIPQLIRHVQIVLQSTADANSGFYLKIGTCGTGGMGLNIPYTHSEDRPSQMLLSKSAIAGAHSLLLFLMARTPGGPIIKELKPAAAIAWKKVGFGPISKRGKNILMEDTSIEDATSLKGNFSKMNNKPIAYLEKSGKPRALEAPYIDTGENGLFSQGEFEALTDEGQMEFITPEEIAQCAVWEIKGLNTGHDIVAALDNSILGPTYRAGYMRHGAIKRLNDNIRESGVDSVAFEILGPPRLSKLLYEGYLLSKCFSTFDGAINTTPEKMAVALEEKISSDKELRSRIISIGIPILLASGDRLVRGSRVAIPADIPGQPDVKFEITKEKIDAWAHDGWVDLRPNNMSRWQSRFKAIKMIVETLPKTDTSSEHAKGKHYWQDEKGNYPIAFAKLASWIFINEDQGERMKS